MNHAATSSQPLPVASPAHRWLVRLLGLSVAILYAVVLAGSVVRASGSGMGCPDWPRCFGRLIPPTSTDQIPPEFMQRFLTEGHGNLFHTWVEFINRLLGAVSGLFILASLILAIYIYLRKRGKVYRNAAWALAVGLGLFSYVAWLGKVVVDTVLAPDKVSFHMLAGIILLGMTICARVLMATPEKAVISRNLRLSLIGLLLLACAQITVGTQVREMVDHLPAGACCDGRLEASLAPWFSWHWLGAATVTLATAAFTLLSRKSDLAKNAPLWHKLPLVLIVVEYVLGVSLIHFHLPVLAQPAHLLVSTFALGSLLVLWCSSTKASA